VLTPPAGPTVGACANADGSASMEPMTAAAITAEAIRRVNIDIVFSNFLRSRDSTILDELERTLASNPPFVTTGWTGYYAASLSERRSARLRWFGSR